MYALFFLGRSLKRAKSRKFYIGFRATLTRSEIKLYQTYFYKIMTIFCIFFILKFKFVAVMTIFGTFFILKFKLVAVGEGN